MPEQPPKARRGCLFYGCFTLIICFLGIILAALLGVYRFHKLVITYTDTHPVAVPVVTLPAAQLEQLQRRVDAFRDAVNAGRATPPLVLTAEEINALIGSDPDFAQAKGKLFVKGIENGRAEVQVSVPLGELGFAMFGGRYLNGTGKLAVTFQNGMLGFTAEDIVAKGKPLTGMYMNKIRSLNLAAPINNNARASVGLNHLQAIQLQDGKVTLTPREEH